MRVIEISKYELLSKKSKIVKEVKVLIINVRIVLSRLLKIKNLYKWNTLQKQIMVTSIKLVINIISTNIQFFIIWLKSYNGIKSFTYITISSKQTLVYANSLNTSFNNF